MKECRQSRLDQAPSVRSLTGAHRRLPPILQSFEPALVAPVFSADTLELELLGCSIHQQPVSSASALRPCCEDVLGTISQGRKDVVLTRRPGDFVF